jgi:hypothetical protein
MIDEKKNAQLKRILDKTDEQMKHFTDLVARHKLEEKVRYVIEPTGAL